MKLLKFTDRTYQRTSYELLITSNYRKFTFCGKSDLPKKDHLHIFQTTGINGDIENYLVDDSDEQEITKYLMEANNA